MKKCPTCFNVLSDDLRKDSIYCSDYCRKKTYECRSGRIIQHKRRIPPKLINHKEATRLS